MTKYDEMDIQYPWYARNTERNMFMLDFHKTLMAQKWIHFLPMGVGMHVCTHTLWHMTHAPAHTRSHTRTHATHTRNFSAKEATWKVENNL